MVRICAKFRIMVRTDRPEWFNWPRTSQGIPCVGGLSFIVLGNRGGKGISVSGGVLGGQEAVWQRGDVEIDSFTAVAGGTAS